MLWINKFSRETTRLHYIHMSTKPWKINFVFCLKYFVYKLFSSLTKPWFFFYTCVILHHFQLPSRVNNSYNIKQILACGSLLPDFFCPRHGQIHTTAPSIFTNVTWSITLLLSYWNHSFTKPHSCNACSYVIQSPDFTYVPHTFNP